MRSGFKYNPKYNIAVLTCVVLAVYWPILGNDFLNYWDDQWYVMSRYTEGGLNLANLRAIFSEFYVGQYSPVNKLMYLLIYSVFGYNSMVFHLASLLLHAACVCLAYIIILRILKYSGENTVIEPSRNMVIERSRNTFIAFITALIFAIHPMNVESVAWISASKIVTYTFFYLLATCTYIIYIDRKKSLYYILTLVLFALSFGCKEQAVTLPVWLLMLSLLSGRTFKDRKLWAELSPFFALAIAFGVVTMFSQASNGGGVLSDQAAYPLWQRFILGCYSLVEYFVKFTIPYNLLYFYPFPMGIGEALPSWMLLYPAIIFVIAFSLWSYLKKFPFSVCLLFFLIHIVLVLHIVQMSRLVVFADRYIYLACIGLAFIVAWYLVAFITNNKGIVRKIFASCFVCMTVCLGTYSNVRCRDWKDTDSIKKEIRELIKKRKDYVPPPEIEKLMEEGKKASKESAMNIVADMVSERRLVSEVVVERWLVSGAEPSQNIEPSRLTQQIGGLQVESAMMRWRVAPAKTIEKTHMLCKLINYQFLNFMYHEQKVFS